MPTPAYDLRNGKTKVLTMPAHYKFSLKVIPRERQNETQPVLKRLKVAENSL